MAFTRVTGVAARPKRTTMGPTKRAACRLYVQFATTELVPEPDVTPYYHDTYYYYDDDEYDRTWCSDCGCPELGQTWECGTFSFSCSVAMTGQPTPTPTTSAAPTATWMMGEITCGARIEVRRNSRTRRRGGGAQ